MKSKITIGLILLVVGITAIIISQTASFTYKTTENAGRNPFGGNYRVSTTKTNSDLKNGILYGGIGFLLIGGIALAISLGKMQK